MSETFASINETFPNPDFDISQFRLAPDVSLFNGTFDASGFLASGAQTSTDTNWDAVKTDLTNLHAWTAHLDESNCYHESMTDAQYVPIVFRQDIADDPTEFDQSLLDVLGVSASRACPPFTFQGEPFDSVTVTGYSVFPDSDVIAEMLEANEDDEEAVDEINAKAAVFEEVESAFFAYVEQSHDVAIVTGFDRFPLLKIGKSRASGLWVGWISLASERYAFS